MISKNMVDRLAALDAAMADLKAEREAIAAAIKADADGGFAEYEGTEHCVTVSTTLRDTVNWKAVAAKLNPSRQLVQAYTDAKPVTTLRVLGKAKLAA
jgi:Tfp pilus assembly protein PilX